MSDIFRYQLCEVTYYMLDIIFAIFYLLIIIFPLFRFTENKKQWNLIRDRNLFANIYRQVKVICLLYAMYAVSGTWIVWDKLKKGASSVKNNLANSIRNF